VRQRRPSLGFVLVIVLFLVLSKWATSPENENACENENDYEKENDLEEWNSWYLIPVT
jgi:hypothetical protein